jgi:succinyl-CoA synthetase beta subunit
MLNVSQSIDFLKLEGLPVVKTMRVNSERGLRRAFDALKKPLVIKLNTAEHKVDIKGVEMNINSFDEALKVFNRLSRISQEVVVQEQVKGLELSLGIKNDPVFKQVIMFGVGGVFIEVLNDVSFRVCPVTKAEAKQMINELRSAKLLKGYRGGESVDLDILASLIKKLSEIAVKNEIKELDINPLIASGKKILIVDARLEI